MNKKQKNKIAIKHQFPTGILVLDNKIVFKGIGLGYQGTATGEVCFNTSLTGYQEIISDPSYAGQIINFTFPHIGNVGTNNEDLESDKIWTRGAIFNSEITSPSNYRALKTLDEWLKKNKIVGLTGLDTRSLTNFIRDKGAPKGTISNNKKGKFNIKKLINNSIKWPGLDGLDLAKEVSTKKMKLGHRGANHPVKNLINNKVEITSQNHGFVVIEKSLSKKIQITHKSLFDNSIEGIKLKSRPVFSVQYHPEANPGPQDSEYLFKNFIQDVKKYAKKKRH